MLIPLLLFVAQVAQDRPAGETRKHLQVLQAVPESQLFLVMNSIAMSLDVNCDYCHVREGETWKWDRDDKPKKDVARRMLKMVADLNAGSFKGSTAVTCFTCHRGSTRPATLPALPPRELLNPSTTPVLPSVSAVLDAYYAAVGGRNAGETFTSTVMVGTDDRTQLRHADIEMVMKGPDKVLLSRVTPPQNTATQVLDGSTGWTRVGTTVTPLAAEQIPRLRFNLSMYQPVKVREAPETMTVAGIEPVGDRTAFVVVAKLPAGAARRYYFDTRTGLLLRELTVTPVAGLTYLQEQFDFEEYRNSDGVMLPFTVRFSDVSIFDGYVRHFSDIRHNAPVDEAIFSRPK
jgi:hypothetical protein